MDGEIITRTTKPPHRASKSNNQMAFVCFKNVISKQKNNKKRGPCMCVTRVFSSLVRTTHTENAWKRGSCMCAAHKGTRVT